MSDSPYGPPSTNNDGNDRDFGQGGYSQQGQHGQQGQQSGAPQGYPSNTQAGYPGAPQGYQSGQQGYESGQQGGHPSATPAPRKRSKLFDDGGAPNQLGLYSFFAGAAVIVVDFVLRLVQAGFIGTGAYAMLGVITLASTVLSFLLGLLAVILGFTALTRQGASKTFAALGLGIGATVLIGAVSGILYSALASAASAL
ncbi:hypothetical protein ACUWEX_01550 [Okibacterium fritillariae]|uniref:hypothetical protein n=1 Tax=Okibacterium fritillariae TaxID=123320 RepID=UPI004055871C